LKSPPNPAKAGKTGNPEKILDAAIFWMRCYNG